MALSTPDGSSRPNDTALAAAYQVTARLYTTSATLVWQRTALFVALNSLAVAGLHTSKQLPPWAERSLLVLGLAYAIAWHFSMARAWRYMYFDIQFMRELETALSLGDLGRMTRGRRVTTTPGKHRVGEEDIEFRRFDVPAKLLADVTTWLFALVYAVTLVRGL